MASYLIFSRERTLDSKELSIYSSQVPATLAGHEVKPLVLYGRRQDLEGAPQRGHRRPRIPNKQSSNGLVQQSILPRSS